MLACIYTSSLITDDFSAVHTNFSPVFFIRTIIFSKLPFNDTNSICDILHLHSKIVFLFLYFNVFCLKNYWCRKVQCVRLIYISFYNITNTSLTQHIICIMARPDVVEREMFLTEFSTGTTLLNERQTLAFFYRTEVHL